MEAEPTISSEHIYSGKVLSLRVDTIGLPEGGTSKREIVEHDESVVIVPIDSEGYVVLVKQYRKAAGKFLLEAPAGGIEKGEQPIDAAEREIQEEIGFKSNNLMYIGGFWMAPGFCTEYMYAYIATDLDESSLPADEDENIEVVFLHKDDIKEAIRNGEIEDSKSIASIMMALNLHL